METATKNTNEAAGTPKRTRAAKPLPPKQDGVPRLLTVSQVCELIPALTPWGVREKIKNKETGFEPYCVGRKIFLRENLVIAAIFGGDAPDTRAV
jgi:hypothetical protein